MSRPLVFAFLAAAALASGPARAARDGRDSTIPILAPGAQVEKVAEGFQFTEGPAVDAQGNVFFSDSPTSRILLFPAAGGPARVWKSNTRGANGMLFDKEGRLITCNSQLAPDGRSVTRYEKNGTVTVLADRYAGKKLNSPNDLAIDKQGRIYFTDPRYGEMDGVEQDRMGVYRIEKNGRLTRVIEDLQVPNGILITPDNKILYVADNSPAENGNRTLVAYDLLKDGSVRRRGVLYNFAPGRGVDGMVLDTAGNIYATAGEGEKTGVYVISPEGRLRRFIHTPETATNCTFGGTDLRTLYITAGGSLYRVRTSLPGALVYPSLKEASHPPKKSYLLAMEGTPTTRVEQPKPAKGRKTEPRPQVIVSGAAAGGYAAFPDICRTKDGTLICVFYSGYAHVSHPKPGWEWGGRIMAVRSDDEGRTWSTPRVIMDTPHDDRDPHIACLSDGTLMLSWFTTWNPADPPKGDPHPHGLFVSASTDGGTLWQPARQIRLNSPNWWVTSAPVRELKDHSLILGLYTMDAKTGNAWGGTIKSYDHGQTWKDLAPIGEKAGLPLDAETDVIALKKKGQLLAALRSSKVDMHFAWSNDFGRSWSEPRDSGFKGHCPIFLRLRNGIILLGHRVPNTSLHWSADDGKTWKGPYEVDKVIGAYPGLVQLPNGDVLCVYYEEGMGSGIRAQRLKVSKNNIRPVIR